MWEICGKYVGIGLEFKGSAPFSDRAWWVPIKLTRPRTGASEMGLRNCPERCAAENIQSTIKAL